MLLFHTLVEFRVEVSVNVACKQHCISCSFVVIQIVPNIPIKPGTVTRGEDYCLPNLTESRRTSPCRLSALYSQVLVCDIFPGTCLRYIPRYLSAMSSQVVVLNNTLFFFLPQHDDAVCRRDDGDVKLGQYTRWLLPSCSKYTVRGLLLVKSSHQFRSKIWS
jgi:hypothetical protein